MEGPVRDRPRGHGPDYFYTVEPRKPSQDFILHYYIQDSGQWTVDISTSPEWRGGGPVMKPSDEREGGG